MDSDKDFMKTTLENDGVDPETSFISSSHVKSDINLGSLGEVNDSLSVTVDASSLDTQLKEDGLCPSTTLMSTNIPDNLVLIETSKGLVLSMPEGSPDGLNFGSTIGDENGRTILTSSLQASIFSQLINVGGIEDSQVQVYDGENGNHVVTLGTLLTDTEAQETEAQNSTSKPPQQDETKQRKKGGGWPKGKKRKPRPEIEPPKKPMTGYVIFALKRRKEIKASNPELQFHVITKILGQEWSNMEKERKEKFAKEAEEDKERYIREMKEFQNSEAYQTFVKSKRMAGEHIQGITDSNDALLDLEDEDGLSELYCKVCNQYFINIHNKKEHMFGRQHIQNITSEIQKDIEKQASLQKQQMLLAAGLDGSIPSQSDGLQDVDSMLNKSPSRGCGSLDLFGFVKDFMEKNSEREHEIHLLRRSKENCEKDNLEISNQIKELEAVQQMLEQELENQKSYGTTLAAHINSLQMVSTLFGVINFEYALKNDEQVIETN